MRTWPAFPGDISDVLQGTKSYRTACECMDLVRRCHFRSRDKGGGHTIGPAIPENPMLHANLMARSIFYKIEVMDDRSLHCGNSNFLPIWLLWHSSWPDEGHNHIQTWPVLPRDIPDVKIWTTYVKAFESYRLTDRQNRPKLYIRPFAGGPLK